MIIIKFGGSAITDKAKECTYKSDVTKQLLSELTDYYDNKVGINNKSDNPNRILNKDFQIILVHGAGSFGHIKAKNYKLDSGYIDDSQLASISEVHRDVRELNLRVMNDFLSYGFPVISIPPMMVLQNSNKEISSFESSIFDEILGLCNIPVTFGDVVTDDKLKFSICSGDTIIQHLAKKFKPTHVIFITSVDGLCTKNPINQDAELIRNLTEDSFARACTDQNINPDVTGGIFLKGKIALNLARNGIKTYIINGTIKGRFRDALSGGDMVGTIAEF